MNINNYKNLLSLWTMFFIAAEILFEWIKYYLPVVIFDLE